MKARICTDHYSCIVVYEEVSCPICRMERELREVMREVDRMSRMLELEEEIQRLEARV